MTDRSRMVFVLKCILIMMIPQAVSAEQDRSQETPKQLWDRLQENLPPFTYDVVKDEVVASDTDPSMNLRKIEIRFISQIIASKVAHISMA